MAFSTNISLVSPLREEAACSICWETLKTWRAFDCLHRLCDECLIKHREKEGTAKRVSCPLCHREETTLSAGQSELQLGFDTITNLPETDVVSSQSPSSESEQNVCENHKDMIIDMFCTTCKTPICQKCKSTEHRSEDNHHCSLIEEYIKTMKKEIKQKLNRLKGMSIQITIFMTEIDSADVVNTARGEFLQNEIQSGVADHKILVNSEESNLCKQEHIFRDSCKGNLAKLRAQVKESKEYVEESLSYAFKIPEKGADSAGLHLALFYQDVMESIDESLVESIDRSALREINEKASGLHFIPRKDEPLVGSLVFYKKERTVERFKCSYGPKDVAFTRDGRLAILAILQGAESYSTIIKETLYKGETKDVAVYKKTDYSAIIILLHDDSPSPFPPEPSKHRCEIRLLNSASGIVSLSTGNFALLSRNTVSTLCSTRSYRHSQAIHPRGIASDLANNIYVSDSINKEIHILGRDMTLQKSISTGNLTPFVVAVCARDPTKILFTGKLLYQQQNQFHYNWYENSVISEVFVIDQSGNHLLTISHPAWEHVVIGCDDHGLVYILWSDAANRRTLQTYDMDGHLVDTLFEKETHNCKELILGVSSSGTAAVVTGESNNGQIMLFTTRADLS